MAYIRTHETAQRRKGKAVKRYEVVWREQATDANGLPIPGRMRARQESYPTREAAEGRRDDLNAAKHTLGGTSALADVKKAGELPFAHYAEGFIARERSNVAAGKLKSRTCERYEGTIRHHLLKPFGAKAVGAITVTDCERFRADLLATRRPRTVRNVWQMLDRVLEYAYERQAIGAVPTDVIDRSASPYAVGDDAGFEPHPLTALQVAALAAKVGERYEVYGLLVLFCAYTGLRAAEVQGLEVRDLTLTMAPDASTRGSVRVQRTKTRRRREWVTGTPKSKASKRTVPLPGWLAARMPTTWPTTIPARTNPPPHRGRDGCKAITSSARRWTGPHRATSTACSPRSSDPPWKRSGYRRAAGQRAQPTMAPRCQPRKVFACMTFGTPPRSCGLPTAFISSRWRSGSGTVAMC